MYNFSSTNKELGKIGVGEMSDEGCKSNELTDSVVRVRFEPKTTVIELYSTKTTGSYATIMNKHLCCI